MLLKSFQEDKTSKPKWRSDSFDHGSTLELDIARGMVSSDGYCGIDHHGSGGVVDVHNQDVIEIELILISSGSPGGKSTEKVIVDTSAEAFVDCQECWFNNLHICSTVTSDIHIVSLCNAVGQ